MATQGFGWQVEVIVSGGGGSPYVPWEDYLITIRITAPNGKKYEASYNAGTHGLRYYETVTATFKGITQLIDTIRVSAKHKLINIRQMFVKVKKL